MSDPKYPNGKRMVRFFERVGKWGRQAEINVALPHIEVPEADVVAEVSAELAWSLVEQGKAEIVEAAQVAPESPEPQVEEVPEVPAQADSGLGINTWMDWFGNKNAGVSEVAPQPESPAAPELAEGEVTEPAGEGDAGPEAPNDPLS